MKTLLTIAVSLLALTVTAQPGDKKSVVIGSMVTKPNALLIVNPQNSDQGVLLPQLSTGQRMSLKPSSPSEDGLIVFDINARSYFFWSNGGWVKLHASGSDESYVSIDPADFRGLNPGSSNVAVFESDNSFVTASRNGEGEEIIASVSLPHGVELKEFTMHYLDNHPGHLEVFLLRKSISGSNEQIIAFKSTGATGAVRSASFNDFNGREKIDLRNYSYRLLIVFNLEEGEDVDEPSEARQRIYGVSIKYQR
jgi:hypothetical protein